MEDLLTTRQLQELLKVDRTTIYRIVKRGDLPAVRVGNQWRFPRKDVEAWLNDTSLLAEISSPEEILHLTGTTPAWNSTNAHFIFPIECVQRIQDAFAEILEVTILVTNPEGTEITRSSNPAGLWDIARTAPEFRESYRRFWAELGADRDLHPQLRPDPLGLLWGRGLIQHGGQLRGISIVGGIAPQEWPPDDARIVELAEELAVPEPTLRNSIDQVHHTDPTGMKRLLPLIQRIGDILEHIVAERVVIVDRMESIVELTRLEL
ncbi:helix-turn-helix domain-containing protein [Gemmatimonadota bacterium]